MFRYYAILPLTPDYPITTLSNPHPGIGFQPLFFLPAVGVDNPKKIIEDIPTQNYQRA